MDFSQSICSHCGGSYPSEFLRQQRKDEFNNKSSFNSRNSNNKHTERNCQKPNKCFICGSEYHFTANFPKPETPENKVHWNTENPKTCAYRSKN